MSAILFGSISTIADTSELQRDAFNRAFEAHGLSWHWTREDYLSMLESSGGEQRIADFAASRGESVDPAAIHQTKSALFQERLGTGSLPPRAGVAETIREAKREGLKVAFVTTTSPENVSALLESVGSEIRATDFDTIVSRSDVGEPKPDKAAYDLALERLGEVAGDCVAIEDNLGGVESARAAGLACVAFPNENTADHDFSAADQRVDRLDLGQLQKFIAAA